MASKIVPQKQDALIDSAAPLSVRARAARSANMFRLMVAVVVKLFDKLVKQRERKWSL